MVCSHPAVGPERGSFHRQHGNVHPVQLLGCFPHPRRSQCRRRSQRQPRGGDDDRDGRRGAAGRPLLPAGRGKGGLRLNRLWRGGLCGLVQHCRHLGPDVVRGGRSGSEAAAEPRGPGDRDATGCRMGDRRPGAAVLVALSWWHQARRGLDAHRRHTEPRLWGFRDPACRRRRPRPHDAVPPAP